MLSILNTIKKMLGIEIDCTDFDIELIPDINSAINAATQLGVGPSTGYSIIDDRNVWTELLGDRKDLEFVKSYIHQKVRLLFDPPTNSYLVEAIERQISELEWRITNQLELTQ